MAQLYTEDHRRLQEEFDTTALAERLEIGIVHEQLTEPEQTFIRTRDMFFLSTVDADGMPTVSYKGGAEGFVHVLDAGTLVFPGYDGNGMFYSVGNIDGQAKVGMLFIDFETPNRLRVQGTAKLVREHALMAQYPEAKYLIFVTVTRAWVNCPRYIHTYRKCGQSKYVPKESVDTPLPGWKQLDIVQDVISPQDRQQAEREGVITLDQYEERVRRGEG